MRLEIKQELEEYDRATDELVDLGIRIYARMTPEEKAEREAIQEAELDRLTA